MVRIARGSIYVWCSMQQISEFRRIFIEMGLSTRQGVWEKTNPAPVNGQHLWLSSVELCVFARKPKATFNEFCASPVWRGPSQRIDGFPCPKPVWLMEKIIKASTNPGDTVLDPCFGSGTTGHACANTGRNFVGIERDLEYFNLASQRIDAAYNPLGSMERSA